MTQAITWGIISAAFTPAGGSLMNITDATDMEFDDDIDIQSVLSDNNVDINLMFGTGHKTAFTIKSSDTSLAWDTNVVPGVAGSLVLVWGKRSAGKGYVSGANKTMTAGNAVLQKRHGAGRASSAGESDFNFMAYSTGSGIFAMT